jgi:hypothetical protein
MNKTGRILFKSFAVFLLLSGNILLGQDLITIAKLPSIINESSGIEETGENSIWTFNDSGGSAELYHCDTIGNLLRTLKINNAWNRDWEDITQDLEGNMYIGNFGNNNNTNKDLTIFKIQNPDKILTDTTSANKISFLFEDQYSFPPSRDSLNFDCEAMFWFKKNLYLFTKHRTLPMATNLYRIPDIAGHHVAKKIGAFYTGKASGSEHQLFDYWITAADISPDGTRICLVSGNKLWVFYDFSGDNFFDGKHVKIDLGGNTQKEAVCFVTNNVLYISDEYWTNRGMGGNLYKINIDSLIEK